MLHCLAKSYLPMDICGVDLLDMGCWVIFILVAGSIYLFKHEREKTPLLEAVFLPLYVLCSYEQVELYRGRAFSGRNNVLVVRLLEGSSFYTEK